MKIGPDNRIFVLPSSPNGPRQPNEIWQIPAPDTERQYPGETVLSEDIGFLSRYGVGLPDLIAAESRARSLGIAASKALICSGVISEIEYYRCVAFELRLEFVQNPPVDFTPFSSVPNASDLDRMARMVAIGLSTPDIQSGSRAILIAPDCQQFQKLKTLLAKNRDLSNRLRLTTHSANLSGLEHRCSPSLLASAIDGLRERYPGFSAYRVISVSQAVTLTLLLQLVGLLILFSTGVVSVFLHLISTLFYTGCIGLRLYASMAFDARPQVQPATLVSQNPISDASLPDYSIVVALYQEAGQIKDLINGLLKLDWPIEKLEIRLVCEADDRETIHAVNREIERHRASHIKLLPVPVSYPRTKPKALNYALPLCRGSLIAVYDAEDRPSPLQLREAFASFCDGPPNLACVQAPLVIINHRDSLLASLFAIEFSGLFGGLLPALTKHRVPIPLGGTSNHFKRAVLENIGGWDPYNVTEDADLGIRLARAGCRIGTIHMPTFEEAPASVSIWIKQRTRWFKGWYQTWLVHFRHPFRLSRDLGFAGTLVFHSMITGTIVSALVHPLLLYFIALQVGQVVNSGLWITLTRPLFILDVATILLGYATFSALAWRTLPIHDLSHLRRKLWAVPLYWMLLSVAAWRAVWHLIRRPHEWEKTPHGLILSNGTPQ